MKRNKLAGSANPNEGHTKKYQEKVEGLGAKVSFSENDSSA